MSRIITWFVHNPVAANLLMAFLVVGGIAILPTIYLEEFPAIDTDIVQVSVEYRGSAPEESEQGVCVRVEEAVEGTPGIKEIRSLAVEGACVVNVELLTGADQAAAYDDIKNAVDGISTLPDETEKPITSLLVMRHEVMKLAISGDIGEHSLRELGAQVRDEIAEIPGVSQVTLEMARDYELAIEVSEQTLRRHGITFDQVASAVRQRSLDLPGGTVKTTGGEILLRTQGQAYWADDFTDIVVLTRMDGTNLTLGEIADIRDGFEDIDLAARFNGRPAVIVEVKRIGEEDILAMADAVHAYIAELRTRLPASVSVDPFDVDAHDLRTRLSMISGNAVGGLILVLATLALFLRFRVAIWVAAGVPISLLGALIWFPVADFSISTMSIMAFLLVIGILVDDAIVVGESVYSYEQAGESQVDAAIKGTHAVHVPVIFGVFTTIAAFVPLVLVPGRMGAFFGVIGSTAIICLIFSLIESQLILPAHLAYRSTKGDDDDSGSGFKAWQHRLSGWLERFGRERYGKALRSAVEYRYVTVATGLGVVLLAVALIAGGYLRYQFFPPIVGNNVRASLTMPPGTPRAVTEAAVRQIEAAADEVREEIGDAAILHQLTTIGALPSTDGPPDPRAAGGTSNKAGITIEMIPGDERQHSTEAVAAMWREKTGSVADAVQLEFASQAYSMGLAIEVELRGPDLDTLQQAAEDVKQELATYPSVMDIADSFRDGKQEVKLDLRPDAQSLGITLQDLARQVRQAFYGEEIQRVQRGRDDVRVMLRYPEDERRSLGALEGMRIRTTDGTEVPFSSVADATLGRGYSTIKRVDRMRVVSVTADVDRTALPPEAIIAELERDLPTLLAPYPGVSFVFQGEQAEHGDTTDGLVSGFAMALLAIYALLAIPLRSYMQPLIIMSVIPFGAIGAIFGHLLLGWDLVFFSILGIVALSGVVVNASLVLVHFVNGKRDEGLSMRDAVQIAGVVRFRPIVLTSVTTFLGLVPLMFLRSVETAPFVPMAVSLAWGVFFSAVVTLFMVPAFYVVLEDVMALRGRGVERLDEGREPVPTAGR